MSGHALNLFPVSGLSGLRSAYRLLEVTNIPHNDQHAENMQRLAKMVAKKVRNPVSPYKEGGKSYLATTANTEGIDSDWRLTPHVALISPDPTERTLDYDALEDHQVELALNILRFNVRTALSDTPGLWNDTPNAFYTREPSNAASNGRVDVFEGFTFRLLRLPDEKIYLALDPTVRYVAKNSLLEKIEDDGDSRSLRFQHFLYRFGDSWYRVQLMGETGYSIKDQVFHHEKLNSNHNVYDYTRRACGAPLPTHVEELSPDSPAIIYRYPNARKDFYGAAGLCFKVFGTDDAEVRGLHSSSVLDPARRLGRSRELVREHLQNVRFGAARIAVSDKPRKDSIRRFPVPDLRFGDERVLHVRRRGESSGTRPQDLGRERMKLLTDPEVGLLSQDPLQAQYVFAPTSLHRSVAETFLKKFTNQMERFLGRNYSARTVLYDDRGARNLHRQVQAIKRAVDSNRIDRGCALLILPANASPDLHNFIKRELFEVLQFQCVSAASLLRHFRSTGNGYRVRDGFGGRFASYVRYTSLGMLLVNHRWPFALDEPLSYDAYVGIDVLNSMSGFTYVYGGGRDCYFRHYQSQQREKLSKNQVRSVLSKDLRADLAKLASPPNSIVIHRDGRSYAQEEAGFVSAIEQLKRDGLLPADVEIGVVQIHKSSSARLRLYEQHASNTRNPGMGAYFPVDSRQGIVCNTGWPFELPGTVIPLHASIVYGDLEIEKVLADIFRLSQLAWSAPDKSSRMPVTIKLGDEFLRPISSEADEEAALYGDEEESA